MMERRPAFEKGMSIREIGEAANRYVSAEWKPLYERMYGHLTAAFREIEDAAYGLYLDQLMPPLFEGLEEAGYRVALEVKEGDFIIGKYLKFSDSLEKWGAEDNRARLFWNIIVNEEAEAIGTLLTEIPHSHLEFKIPSMPQLYALSETGKERIRAAIHHLMQK